jgi:hypothetical protein
MYGKPGCHLCEDARHLLDRLGKRYPLLLEEIDIRSDPSLFRRFDIRIPVIVVEDRIELSAPISEQSVITALGHRGHG